MRNRHDLHLVRLDGEVNDVLKPSHNCEAEVNFGRGDFTFGESLWIRLDLGQHVVNRSPEFVAKSFSLRIEPAGGCGDFVGRRREYADSHEDGPSESRCWTIARVSSRLE